MVIAPANWPGRRMLRSVNDGMAPDDRRAGSPPWSAAPEARRRMTGVPPSCDGDDRATTPRLDRGEMLDDRGGSLEDRWLTPNRTSGVPADLGASRCAPVDVGDPGRPNPTGGRGVRCVAAGEICWAPATLGIPREIC